MNIYPSPCHFGQALNGKRKYFKVNLEIQVTKFEFPIQGPIWRIGSPLSSNFRDGECQWEEGLPYLDVFHSDRDRKPPSGDALILLVGINSINPLFYLESTLRSHGSSWT